MLSLDYQFPEIASQSQCFPCIRSEHSVSKSTTAPHRTQRFHRATDAANKTARSTKSHEPITRNNTNHFRVSSCDRVRVISWVVDSGKNSQ
jgi:hypothetical protein